MTSGILRPFLLASLFACSALGLRATPPLAPSNGTMSHTHFGLPFVGNGTASVPQVPADKRHSWRVTWQDNANDEEGYHVLVRYGTAGPFSLFGILPANSTTHAFSVSDFVTSLVIPVQIKVEAWKYNGAATETSSLTVSQILEKPVTTKVWGPLEQVTCNLVNRGPGQQPALSDGQIKLDWGYVRQNPDDDNSPLIPGEVINSELGYEVQMREAKAGMVDADWFSIGNFLFNTTNVTLSNLIYRPGTNIRLQFIPGKRYQFRVRPTRNSFVNGSMLSPPASFEETSGLVEGGAPETLAFLMPSLNAPSNLGVSAEGEKQLRLTWKDNSDNETGYKIEYRAVSSGPPTTFTADQSFTVGEGVNNVLVPFIQNGTLEFRVCALFEYTPAGGSKTTIQSDFAAIATGNTPALLPPTNLTAVPSPGLEKTIDLAWKDNSTSEFGFDIWVRAQGTQTWKFARGVHGNVTQASVDSMHIGTLDSKSRPNDTNFAKLVPGTAYEFIVRTVADGETSVSLDSNTAVATPRNGFTMPRLYHPAQVGQSFQYHLTTTPEVARTGWNASQLPPGLSFSSSTGIISGTPTQSGVFEIPLTASLAATSTAAAATPSATLTLRIVSVPAVPVVTTPIPDTTVGLNATAVINLANHFSDPGAEKAARLETNRGNIDIDLFATLAPEAVTNFLSYVNAGDYDGVAFHRLAYNDNGTLSADDDTPFVLQGGSMKPAADPKSFTSVGRRESPINEPGISNLRGTISAAKVGGRNSVSDNNTVEETPSAPPYATADDFLRGDLHGMVGLPNSATTDFFLNPVNNAGNLDNQNGGFTAYGRLTDASLQILDQIVQLPRGNFSDSILNGSNVPMADFPINAGTAPANMDNTKAVKIIKARSIPVMTYTINEVSADKAAVVVENGLLKITGLAAGTRSVTVTARDLDGNTLPQTFTINVTPGFQPPVITKHPVSATVNVKANVTLGVTATGTGLTYQWRRGGTNITGRTDSKLVLANVQAGDSGVYDVVVTAGGQSVTSSAATLAVRVPADITTSLPNELLVEAGQPLYLPLTATGSPAPVVTWRRGATVVKGQTNPYLYIESAALADAGVYTATAVNGSTDKSNACTVLVVDKGTTTVVAAAGKPVKLTAPAAGPFLGYHWFKGATSLINQPGFTGADKAVLTINPAQPGESGSSGNYTCQLTLPGNLAPPTSTTGIVHLAVSSIAPQLDELALPDGYVGGGYTYTISYQTGDQGMPSSFSVTGLPPGLALNTTTGVISGRPTRAGTYAVTARASNPTGTGSPVTGTIRIIAPEAAGAGTYVGIVNPAWTINDGKGGRVDLTVTDNSAWSAKLQLGKDIYNLKGTMTISISSISGSSSLVYSSGVNFASKTGKPLSLYFELNPANGDVTGYVSSSTEIVEVNGYRLIWSATRNGCVFTGLYNIALTLAADHLAQPEVPQGDGYTALSTTPAGIGTLAGRLPDGSTITSSAFVGRAGQSVLFQMLYKNTGSLIARMGITTPRDANSADSALRFNSYNGSARWTKDKQPAAERNYQPGFASTLLNLRGWAYQAPVASITPIVMNLPGLPGNASLVFKEGGLTGASRNPDITFRLTNANLPDFTGASNPAKVTLKVSAATGAYSGTFELEDNGIKRPVTFQGLIIPAIAAVPGLDSFSVTFGDGSTGTYPAQPGRAPSPSYGAGYFLLDKLPVPPATKSTALLSGSARLGAPSIRITTQPVSQTVNPGANVTFTCAAEGGLGATPAITYQWRKNGIDIANATTTTLSLTSVQQAAEGEYDCVIRKNSVIPASGNISEQTFVDTSVTITQIATLTVNDPVSDIIILQNPAKNIVPTGSVVTFTAEHKGTGPFTYQWRRNGTDIEGATEVSHTTGPVSNDNSGTYTVLVKNDISTDGVLSSGKNLTHGGPVNAVTASRTPASTKVAAGTSVVFKAAVSGASPLYQWLKNDIPISAANGATFTIPSVALSDSGTYKVQVTNSVTVDAITSSVVPLTVTTEIPPHTVKPSFAGTAAPLNTDITLTAEPPQNDNGTYTYQWRRNEVDIPDAISKFLTVSTGGTVNFETPDRYDVLVKSAALPEGVLTAPFELRVGEAVGNVLASRSPSSQGVDIGTSVTFSVSATGTNLAYQWRKDGTNIANATQSTYNIPSFAGTDSGSYTVLVSNAVTPAGVLSNPVDLSNNSPVTSASITLVSPGSTNVPAGTNLVFQVTAQGGFDHTYQWRKNGEDIPGATSPQLQTEAAGSITSSSVYDCRVSNPMTPDGIYSTTITITIE